MSQDLKQWTIDYIRSRDAAFQQIAEIITDSKEADIVIVHHDGKKKYFLVANEFGTDLLARNITPVTLVVLNTRANLGRVIGCWKQLTDRNGLTLFFVNPNSSTENKWSVNPAVHARVTEERALKSGLETLFLTVEEVRGKGG